MIRDKRKNSIYFKEYLDCQKIRIIKKEEKLLGCSDDVKKKNRINLSLLKYKIDYAIAEYSAGCSDVELRGFIDDSFSTAVEMPQIDYESLLILLSIAVMIDYRDKAVEMISIHNSEITSDKLLNFLGEYIKNRKIVWRGEFYLPKVYGLLGRLENSDNQEEIMLEYLDCWYDNHKSTSWYESDKGKSDTYVGYWSFESAAIVKILSIGENRIKEKVFYPKI